MKEEQRDKLKFAEEKLSTAKLLLDNQKFEDSVSRAYYAMFHAAKALLMEKDSKPRTHSGTVSELGKLYREEMSTKLSREFSRIQEKRERADYGEISDLSKEDTEEILDTAEKFVKKAKNILE